MAISEVEKKRVYRGPHPLDMAPLQGLGVKTILNLETGVYEFVEGELYTEDQRASVAEIGVVHLKLSDFFPPSAADVKDALVVMTSALKTPVYVHCLHGVDRTGFICAAYRVLVQGWDVEAAIAEMERLGFHAFPYFFWVWRFRYLMKTLKGQELGPAPHALGEDCGKAECDLCTIERR